MNHSTNYSFNKPELTDAPDITKVSEAIEAIDGVLYGKADASDIPTVPTKTSDLTNDSGFLTSNDFAVETLTDFTVERSSGNSTCTVRNAVKSGNMIMLSLSFKCTSAYTAQNLSDHANLFVGTVPAKYKPACTTSGVGYIDSQAVVAHISGTSTRQITVRPTAQLANNKEPYVYFTYFI